MLQISLWERFSTFELVEIPLENSKNSTGTMSKQILRFSSKSPISKVPGLFTEKTFRTFYTP